jgi:NitT/TauT family transport system permease protein
MTTRSRQAGRGLLYQASGLLFIFLLVLVWELSARWGVLPAEAVPPPSRLAGAFIALVRSGEILDQLGRTAGRAVAGFVAGGLAGSLLGFACGVFPGFGRAVGTTAEFLRPMPSVALIPIGILFLGLGFGLCVAVAGFACCWPAYVAALAGAGAAGAELRDTARAYGLGRLESIVFVLAPAALPQVAAGLRTGLGVAVAVTVTTEMAAAPDGLGSFILEASMAGQPARMYAGIVAVGLLGAGLNVVFNLARQRALGWLPREQRP